RHAARRMKFAFAGPPMVRKKGEPSPDRSLRRSPRRVGPRRVRRCRSAPRRGPHPVPDPHPGVHHAALARGTQGGRARGGALAREQWMAAISPTYTPQGGLGPTDTDCRGHSLFANESLRGGISTKSWPRPFDPDELDIKSGPEGMRVIWLRVLKFENGDVGG